jgi:hypothetical protein
MHISSQTAEARQPGCCSLAWKPMNRERSAADRREGKAPGPTQQDNCSASITELLYGGWLKLRGAGGCTDDGLSFVPAAAAGFARLPGPFGRLSLWLAGFARWPSPEDSRVALPSVC